MEVKTEPHQYQWIINEGLLRDEGTLYGIAGASFQEKIEAIKDYYRIKKAAPRTKQEHLENKIADLGNHLSQGLSSSDNPGNRGDFSNSIPIIVQLLFLVSYWLSPVFHSAFICIGLYLFGLFSVFIGRSIMYNAAPSLAEDKNVVNHRQRWKIYFEEFGVPLIVSLFISILPARAYPIEFSVIITFLFFMLFLLGGKALINTVFRARKELGLYFQYLQKKKGNKAKTKELRALQADLESTSTAVEELNGEEEYKIKVFTSEYKLAFESRQLANGVPLKRFA